MLCSVSLLVSRTSISAELVVKTANVANNKDCCNKTLIAERISRQNQNIDYVVFPNKCKQWTCVICGHVMVSNLQTIAQHVVSQHQMYHHQTITCTDPGSIDDIKKVHQYATRSMLRAKARLTHGARGRKGKTLDELKDDQINLDIQKLAETKALYKVATKHKLYLNKLPDYMKRAFKNEHLSEIDQLKESNRIQFEARRDGLNRSTFLWNKVLSFFGDKPYYLGIREDEENQSHFHILSNVPITEPVLKHYQMKYTSNHDSINKVRFIFWDERGCTMEQVNNRSVETKMTQYITKYVTKGIDDNTFNRNYIFKSRNIALAFPKSADYNYDIQDIMDVPSEDARYFTNLKDAYKWIDFQEGYLHHPYQSTLDQIKSLDSIDILDVLSYIFNSSARHSYDPDIIRMESTLTDDQKHALTLIMNYRLVFINGAAGTGKTELIKHINADLMISHTGISTQNMRNRSNSVEIETIAKMIRYSFRNECTRYDPIHVKVVVIDECLTIPGRDLLYFLTLIPKDTRIIFLGDQYQNHNTPSIYQLLVKFAKSFELTEQMRFTNKLIVKPNDQYDIRNVTTNQDIIQAKNVGSLILANTVNLKNEINSICQNKTGIRFGLYNYSINDPVMIIKNNSLKKTVNGQLCIVKSVNDYGIKLEDQNTGSIYFYYSYESHQIELAYCITIQKAQSGEWDTGLVVLSDSKYSTILNKHLLYVARSRFKKALPDIITYDDPDKIRSKIEQTGFYHLTEKTGGV